MIQPDTDRDLIVILPDNPPRSPRGPLPAPGWGLTVRPKPVTGTLGHPDGWGLTVQGGAR